MANHVIPEGFEIESSASIPEGFELEKSTMLTDPVKTLQRSGGEYISGMAQTVLHPIKTAKGIGKTAIGVVQLAIPGEQEFEPFAEAVGKFYVDRYGSIEKAKYTAISDPVGFLADASTALAGVGGIAKAAGTISKVNKLSSTGRAVGNIANKLDPISIAINATGEAANRIVKGRKLSIPGNRPDTDILNIAREMNVDLPASAVASSRFVPLAESFASKGLFGAKMNKKIVDAKDRIVQIAEETVRDVGKSPDLAIAGNALYKGADKFRDVYMRLKNRMYERAGISEKASKITLSPAELQNTSSFIDDILIKKQAAAGVIGDVSDTGIFKKIQNAISGKDGSVNAFQVRSALQELNEKLSDINDPVITGNKGAIRKLVATLSDDLDAAIANRNPELASDIAKANAVYKRGIDILNSSYGEKIFQLKDQPDKIVNALFNKTTSIEDIPRIYTLIGKKNIPYVQSSVLEQILEGAKNDKGVFSPAGISRQIDRYGDDKLSKILTPDQYSRLQKINKLSKSMSNIEKISEGSQTAFVARVSAEFAPFFINPLLSIKAIFGDIAASNFISSTFGQKLMSEGVTFTGQTGKNIKRAEPTILGKKIPLNPIGRVITRASRGQGVIEKEESRQLE